MERICFQIEEAQWFYEDFIRPLDPGLQPLNLRNFCLAIFKHCPLFSGYDPESYSLAFSEFLAYKTRVPVRGAIMLNDAMDECVLVKGWKKGANWSFPRGKINKDERDLDCAIREVYEETGFDVMDAGLAGEEEDARFIEVTMREQHMKLFVFRGVPKETYFAPRTRKEISSIQWYKLSDLPTNKKKHQQQEGRGEDLAANANKFYMVAPFLPQLRKIIAQWKRDDAMRHYEALQAESLHDWPRPVEAEVSPEEVPNEDSFAGQQSLGGNDMDRLLGQLRQSKEASNEALGLPEVGESYAKPQDQSAQLRSLLNLPTNMTTTAPDAPIPANTAPPPQLNRNFSPFAPHILEQMSRAREHAPRNEPPPQTPMDQIFGGPPDMPPSPKHLHRGHGNRPEATHVSPPSFPYSPAQVQRHGPMQYQVPTRPSRVPTSSYYNVNQAAALQPAKMSSARSRSPAPYQQRTGDHQFNMFSSETGHAESAVPEASRLPTPTLNAHSSALLSLFKIKSPAQPRAPAEPPAEAPKQSSSRPLITSSVLDTARARIDPTPQPLPSLGYSFGSYGEGSSMAKLEASAVELGSVVSPPLSRAASQQQAALLELFKAPSSRPPQLTGPALTPARSSHPAELSALRSPISPEPSTSSLVPPVPRTQPPVNPQSGKITIQKRPAHTNSSSIANSISATVTGPLNIAQSEIMSSTKSPPTAGTTASKAHTHTTSGMTPGSVKILSRPGTANGNRKEASSLRAAQPAPSPRQGRSPRRSPRRSKAAEPAPKEPPKLFQPQILRRPAAPEPAPAQPVNPARQLFASPPRPSVAVETSARTPSILRRDSDLASPSQLSAVSPKTTPSAKPLSAPLQTSGNQSHSSLPLQASAPLPPPPPSTATIPGFDAPQFQVPALPAPASSAPSKPAQAPVFPPHLDRRASQTAEHKSALLSLFTRTSSGAGPGSIASSGSFAAAQQAAAAVSPLTSIPPSRSRMDSFASFASLGGSGDGSAVGPGGGVGGAKGDGRKASTASPADKKFLLGFLEEVAKEGKV